MRTRLLIVGLVVSLIPLIVSAQWTQHDVAFNLAGAYGVATGDFDGDGDMDIVAGADGVTDEVHWYENTGGGWSDHLVESNFGAKDVCVADVDVDGDADILACAYTPGYVTWWENNAGAFTRHDLSVDFNGAYAIAAGDINNDGLTDVACVAWAIGDVVWWENTGAGWIEHVLSYSYSNPHGVALGDLNGDGMLDVVASSGSSDDVVWWENQGDNPWPMTIIQSNLDYASAVSVTDFEGDGDDDVIAAIYNDSHMVAFTNDGIGNFTQTDLSFTFNNAWNCCAGDIGADGDMDAIGSSRSNGISYWEYEDGSFTEHELIPSWGDVRSVFAADMDGDNDDDIVAVSETLGQVSWWEQPGSGTPDLIELEVFPHNPPVIIPAGGTLTYDIHIESHLPQTVYAYIWTWVEMPNGQLFGPLDARYGAFTPTLDIFFTGLTQDIPTLAMTGVYQWNVSIGTSIQNPAFTDGFSFTVTDPEFQDGAVGWTSTGWDNLDFAGEADEKTVALPTRFSVSEVYPNPFNSNARVSVTLPDSDHLAVQVFDNLGRRVAELADGEYSSGSHELTFEPSSLSSGIYFMSVNVGGTLVVRKLVYMK